MAQNRTKHDMRGCLLRLSKITRAEQVCPGSSSFDCEVTAILMALHCILGNLLSACDNILIIFDLLSVLNSISASPYPNINISVSVIKIRHLLQRSLQEGRTHTVFAWAPARTSILGN